MNDLQPRRHASDSVVSKGHDDEPANSVRGQFARFVVAGTLGFVVDAGLLYAALWLGAGYFLGRALSFLGAVWVTWQFNRRITFAGKRDRTRSAWNEWWHYLLAMAVGGLVNYAAYSAVVLVLHPAAWVPLAAVAAGSGAGMLINFASARLWVFRVR